MRGPLTADGLRELFRGTRLPQDPREVALPPGSERWPAALRGRLIQDLRLAGVLIPIMQHAGHLTVLLTRRAADLQHHPGQIAFPGGRMDEADDDLCMTALRETAEEVGIPPQRVSVIGYLDAMPTITGYAVTPVVGLVDPPAQLVIDPVEVEYAFEVPLDFLLDERNVQHTKREYHGQLVPMIEFHFEGRRIWGVTANLLHSFRQFVLK